MSMLALVILALLAPPPLPVVATAQRDGAVVVEWQAPPGVTLTCLVRRAPSPMEPLACVRGAASHATLAPGGDVALRLRAGDVVEVRAFDAAGGLVGRGRAVVAWRAWLPVVGHTATPPR